MIGSGHVPVGGGLPREGVGGQQVRYVPPQPRDTVVFGGKSQENCREFPEIRGAKKSSSTKIVFSLWSQILPLKSPDLREPFKLEREAEALVWQDLGVPDKRSR